MYSFNKPLRTMSLLAALLAVSGAYAEAGPAPAEEEIWGRVRGSQAEECAPDVTQGAMRFTSPEGRLLALPLAHTSVDAEVSGFLAQVWVTQYFTNPYNRPIEAVYVFPLPENAAVDNMEMEIGSRTIRANLEERGEAKRIYEEAKNQGKTAGLLEQERPNVFTQSVANILPGDRIKVRIRYVQDLTYDSGNYEFVFPMVVGPRYVPGHATGATGGGFSPDTDQVPDGSRITPPVLRPGDRSGHDIDVTLTLNGLPEVDQLTSPSHDIVRGEAESGIRITLAAHDTIPNKDLIVRYRVVGEEIRVASLFHRSKLLGAYFMLLMLPDAAPADEVVVPRELVFVLDCSGSMSGAPLVKSKEAVKMALKAMRPGDTFQIFEFSDVARGFASKPVPNTPENLKRGLQYVDQISEGGGTQMIEGIKAALDYPLDAGRVRLVMFLTDGYIGNEAEILDAVGKKLGESRLFSFGIGSSVNRYLLDKMAEVGRGAVTYVRQDESVDQAVERFFRRIDSPVLMDIDVAAKGDAELTEVFPARVPDLFAGQPLVVFGKYKGHGQTTVTISGRRGNGRFTRELKLQFPKEEERQSVLATLWARTRIEYLMGKMLGGEDADIKGEVIRLSKEYRVLSQYTAFVAVEEVVRNANGKPEKVMVPVEIPEGVSYEGVFGKEEKAPAPMGRANRGGGGKYAPTAVAPSSGPSRPKMRAQTEAAEVAKVLEAVEPSKDDGPADKGAEPTHFSVKLSSCAVLSGQSTDRAIEEYLGKSAADLASKLETDVPAGTLSRGVYSLKAKVTIGEDGAINVEVTEMSGGVSTATLEAIARRLDAWLTDGGVLRSGIVKLTLTLTVQ